MHLRSIRAGSSSEASQSPTMLYGRVVKRLTPSTSSHPKHTTTPSPFHIYFRSPLSRALIFSLQHTRRETHHCTHNLLKLDHTANRLPPPSCKPRHLELLCICFMATTAAVDFDWHPRFGCAHIHTYRGEYARRESFREFL